MKKKEPKSPENKVKLNEEQGENVRKFLMEKKGWKSTAITVPELPWKKEIDGNDQSEKIV